MEPEDDCDHDDEEVLDHGSHIDVNLGPAQWQTPDGKYILEEDFKVAGEVWRVHLNDADPFPSIPHAHCIGGAKRFVGCTLHLGTAELFRKRESLNRHLERNQFQRLCELIQPKFPAIKLPLAS
jgi:hypothetical protein